MDLLDIASLDILERYNHLLPDLRAITVFLPNNLVQKSLREKLTTHACEQGSAALLLPTCTMLRNWTFSKNVPNKPVLSQYARELILVDAISKYGSLFENANPWMVAQELLSLFDALLLSDIGPECFQNYLANDNLGTHNLYTLSQEADLVTILWQAWQQQISHGAMLDPVAAYVQALQKIEFSEHEIYYTLGLDKVSKCEITLLEKIDRQAQLQKFIHASNVKLSTRPDAAIENIIKQPEDKRLYPEYEILPYAKFLNAVFTDDGLSIQQRAITFAKNHPDSPAAMRLKVFKSTSLENHIKALDIKIRSCIHANKNNIGVITTDRKLVRRLRAVLEHANVPVNDLGGWALSTTSAVVVIECLLQLIEEGYPANQLLALVKSPFLPVSVDKAIHEKAVNFFEKNIILAFNLYSDLHRFRTALKISQARSADENAQTFTYLNQLVDKIAVATQSLAKLCRHNKSIPLHRFFEELLAGLKALGIYAAVEKDAAGKQILELLEIQIADFKNIENAMDWFEWRRLLARILDQKNFKLASVNANVTFCNLEQSRLLKFDTVIIASVVKNRFPGASLHYTFFNESIRSELNISTWRDEHALYFYLFRALLDAAPDILITVQNEQNEEQMLSSPWLEAIETFHLIAYATGLSDTQLQQLVGQDNTTIEQIQPAGMPALTSQPAPILKDELKPDAISISQYQALINCPYQFYASVGLKLAKTNKLSEELDKTDFGTLVHKCIHLFFTDEPSMPGPFIGRVTAANRAAAEQMLISISEYLFDQNTQRGFIDELWLCRWVKLIPKFIDWEIQRQKTHTPYEHEVSLQKNINSAITLRGRIDRIDRMDEPSGGYAVIDYKTGLTPSTKKILAGEQAQLPAYAMLHGNCVQVEYVSIGKNNNVKAEAVIKEGRLQELIMHHQERLVEFSTALLGNTPLKAFTDDETCGYCEARGICRKDYWQS